MESAAPPEAPAVAEAVPMVVEPPPIDTLAPAAPVAEPEPAVSAPVTDAGAAAPASVTVRVTQSAPPAAGDPGPYRQLKVEDALAYLDKVRDSGAAFRFRRGSFSLAAGLAAPPFHPL